MNIFLRETGEGKKKGKEDDYSGWHKRGCLQMARNRARGKQFRSKGGGVDACGERRGFAGAVGLALRVLRGSPGPDQLNTTNTYSVLCTVLRI
jgi:hypothetical protein